MSQLQSAAFLLAIAVPLARAQERGEAERSEAEVKIEQLLQQAEAAEEMGNVDEAESLLRAALDVDARSVTAVVALGRFLHAQGQGAEGFGLLYRALELDARNHGATVALVDALLMEADAYAEQGDSGNSEAQVARALDVLERTRTVGARESPELELRRVRVLSRSEERSREAFELATKLVAASPDDEVLHAALVDAATAAKEFEPALAFYESTEMAPWLQSWFTAALRGARATWNFNRYGDDEQAVQDYLTADAAVLEAARVRPVIFEAASERASFYRSWAGWVRFTRQQRAEEAWDLFMSAAGRHPENVNAIEGMSWICQRLYEAGELEKVRECSRQLCVVASERADFWNNYGLICRDTGHFEESYRAYRRAMALAPDDSRIVNDCALILLYHLHRDLDLAERWFIRAEDLARDGMERAKRDEDEALLAEQSLVLGDALTNLARLYADQGRMQEAAEHWNELRAIDPTRPELPEHAGGAPPPSPNPPQKGASGSR